MYSFFLFSKSFPKCEKVFTYIYDVRYFRKDAHAQAASLRKTSFSYINIFCLAQLKYFHRTVNIGKLSKNKSQVTWDISHNFACVGIFFPNNFTWKQNCAIFSKLQMYGPKSF